MLAPSDLLPFLVLALAGSLHCAGMCGGFALGVTAGASRGRALGRLALYVLGKSATYVVLGIAAAHAAHAFRHAGAQLVTDGPESVEALSGLRSATAWMAGGCLILFGLHGLGWLARLEAPFRGRRLLPIALAQRLFAAVKSLPGPSAAFGIGVVTGLLPCGLSWSAFLLATQVDPATAATGLLIFGLATGPVLTVVGLGPSLLPVGVRARANRLVGPLLVVFGLFTIVRGGLPGPLERGEELLPECCRGVEAADG